MTPVPATTSVRSTYRTSARIFGAINALTSLALSVLLGAGLADIAHGGANAGLWILVIVLTIRWLVTAIVIEWGDHVASIVRDRWRRVLPWQFRQPRSEHERSRADLALAVENAGEEPALELLAASAVIALGGLLIVFWAAGWLCLFITTALLAVAVPLYRRAGQRSEAMALAYEQRRALLESRQLELLLHSTELRALGAVPYGADEIAAISNSEHAIALRAIRVALESSLVTEFLSGVSIGLVAMVVGFALLGGRITLAHALIAVLVTSEVFVHVRRYGSEFHRRDDAIRSRSALDTDDENEGTTRSQHLLVADGLVTHANDQVVSFVLSATDRIFVNGPSGSGKTTLLHTLLNWRAPEQGIARHSALPIGYVSTESALLSGTLRDNLTLGSAVDDAVVTSCLGALDLTGPRFEDLNSVLLADGRGISSGERVRLVLARALLADAALLVLDDVAGVLDAATRQRVRQALDARDYLTIVEAAVDTPLLDRFDVTIELT